MSIEGTRPPLFERGTRIAGYRVERVLGAGGMGVVYEATQTSLNRTVALKVLPPALSTDSVFRKRFQREAELQALLDHPHIVTVHEAGDSDYGLFMAMRLVRGPTLKDMIVSRELDPGRSIRILIAVAGALDAAHARGLIHRDVKPQNILVGGRDHPYLADFGLTQAADLTHLTASGQFVGTFDYVSPEQIEGHDITPSADVYSLACVLYECLTGQVPFPKRSQAALIYAHLQAEPPRVTAQRPELPAALDDVVARGMAKETARRPASATALMADAERAFDRRTRAMLRPPGPVERPQEVGVREPEGKVSTAEAARRADDARTEDLGRGTFVASPERDEPAQRRRRPPIVAAAIALAVAALIAGGVLGAARHSSATGEPLRADASVGALELSYPSAWRRVDSKLGVPGLHLRGPIRIAATRDGRSGVAAGMAAANGPLLLPSSLTGRLPAKPKGQAVRLGDLQALRYDGLRPRGASAPVTLFAAPTSAGVATVACIGQARCAQVASTLKLHGVKPAALGADPAYARVLHGALAHLAAARNSQRARLRAARTPAAQSSAAGALATAYAAAARTLAGAAPGPWAADVHAGILAALRQTEAGYRALASAASHGNARAYRSASAHVAAGERALMLQLQGLRSRGYRVG